MTSEINEKYSLSIYHFNIQYVAGNVKTYHHLHKSSMKPYLKFFDTHPQWKGSCEIQGHYLKFMQRYYPEDLAILRKLNLREQIEMVSVHYSDQIYLAYPERDLQESININNEVFGELGLNRSNIWFGQENFFGQGIAERIMERNGYQTALLNNHFVWHHDNNALRKAPYWKFNGVDHDRVNYLVSAGQGYENDADGISISQKFSYWDDAELAFGSTPYAPFLAKPQEQYLTHIWKYKQLEKEGYQMVRAGDYINRVKELDLKPDVGPYLTDATWNTRYYGGTYLWMGYYRLPWEKDARIRSLTYRIRSNLLVEEQLIKWAGEKGVNNLPELKLWLRYAWRHLLLAEVSDSTGQQPFPIEIEYSKAECKDCQRYLDMIHKSIKSQIQIPHQYIDTYNKDFCDEECQFNEIESQIPLSTIASWFPQELSCLRVAQGTPKLFRVNDEYGQEDRHYILDFKFKTQYTPFFKRVMAFFRDGEKKVDFTRKFDRRYGNYAGISFPMWERKAIYSPACMEDSIKILNENEFDFKRTWLPLPNGLIGLGNDLYVIKHNAYGNTHIACTLNFEEEQPYANFHVLNPFRGADFTWRYSIFRGSQEEALKIANSLNIFPTRKI